VAYSNAALPAETRVHYHFGGEGTNYLIGDDLSDHLYGMDGNDVLNGGKGDDYLEGGEGVDTYIINSGDGYDTVVDDGYNILVIDGEAFTGVFFKVESTGHNLFIGDDENCTMVFNLAATLTINDSTSLTFANQTSAADFADNDFGLTLLEEGAQDNFDITLDGTEDINTSEVEYFNGDNAYFYGFFNTTTIHTDGSTDGEWLFYQEQVSLETSFHLTGGGGNDRLVGLLGADHLAGGEGNDWVWGVDVIDMNPSTISQGGDLLEGGPGIDWLNGSSADDAMHGGDDNDILAGLAGGDILMGENGSDIMVGGADNDVACGGNGEDVLLGDGDLLVNSTLLLTNPLAFTFEYADGYLHGLTSTDIQLDMNSPANGNDRLFGGEGNDYLNGGYGNDILSGDAGNDNIWGDNESISGGNDQLYGGSGDDLLHGGGGNDYLFGDTDNDSLFGEDGEDELQGGSGNDQLLGDAGDDLLCGDAGDDQLKGNQGNDTLRGGPGADILDGGEGDDVYILSPGDGMEHITDQDGDNLILFEGVYTLATLEWMRATINPSGTASYDPAGQDIVLRYGSGDTVLLSGGFTAQYSIQFGDGSAFNSSDFFASTVEYQCYASGNDTLSCDDASNRIYAGNGHDTIHGMGGDDAISGGNGFHEDFLDLLRQYYPWLEPEQVSFATELSWAGDTGNIENNNDVLYGDDGNDVIDGGTGFDALFGGNGNDALYGGEGGDTLEGGDGDDLLIGGDDNLNIPRPGAEFDDLLFGGNGADQLFGESGDDQLDGGEDDDRLAGGLGDDSLSGGPGADILDGGEGEDTADYTGSGQGVTVDLATGIGLGGDAEGDLLVNIEHVYGSGFNDTITGDEQENTIFGWGGDDTIHGGSGNDVLEGVGRLHGDGGNDVLSGGGMLDGGDGDDDLHGSGLDGWGMGGADILIGGIGNDHLYGDDGHDILRGDEGDDVLDGGGTGDVADQGFFDLLEGGAGNDTYLTDGVHHFFDIVNDREGSNTIEYRTLWNPQSLSISDLSVGFVNVDQQELARLMAQEDNNDSDYQNRRDAFINQIGKISRWIAPESHQDLWISFQGRDVTGQDQCAVFIILGGRDTDLNYTYDLGAGNVYSHAEILAEAIASSLSPYYGEENDVVEGDELDNALYGGGGDDEIYGGVGRDTLEGESGNDQICGESGNDTLLGGAGGDQLNGGEGDDFLAGGMGNDHIIGATGDDIYFFERGDGQDSIDDYDFASSTNILRFGDGLSETDILVINPGNETNDLVLRVRGSTDEIRLGDYGAPDDEVDEEEDYSSKIDRIEFADGSVWNQAAIEARAVDNHAPIINTVFSPLRAQAGQLFTATLPVDIITDPDTWDTITAFSMTTCDGSTLPSWLTFDAGTLTLSGTPTPGNVGSLHLIVSAVDSCATSAESDITIEIAPANRAPVIEEPLPDTTTALGNLFSLTIAPSTFSDPDGDNLTYNVTLADGQPLPAWLSFDPINRSLSGIPLSLETLSVQVTVTDNGSLTATELFDLSVILVPTLTGTAGADSLIGGNGNDVIAGLEGNDIIRGLSNNDALLGGDGNDVLNGGTGADLLDGSEGQDTADYRGDATGVLINLATGAADGGSAEGDTLRSIENIYGTDFDDALTGSDQDNILRGYNGNDRLSGREGNDYLLGDNGIDQMFGGSGNDVLHGGADADILDGGEGRDTTDYRGTTAGVVVNLDSGIASGGAAEGDILLAIENIHATDFDDTLTGSDQDNTLFGYGGNDLLVGLDGNDYLRGENGTDHLLGGRGNDVLHGGADADILDGGEGRDTIDYRGTVGEIAINLALNAASGGEAEGDLVFSIENVYATDFDDTVTGSDQDNTLLGYGGNDLLAGLEGNDSLRGENGTDHLLGGRGNDVLHGGADADILDGGEGRDTTDYRGTTAGVVVNLDSGIASGGAAEGDILLAIENIHATDFDDTLTGSDQDNTLFGYGGNDLLVGLDGNDYLRGENGTDHLLGGRGNDVLHGGADADILDGGEGRDTIDYRGTVGEIAINLALNAASGGEAEGDLVFSIENVYATDFDDTVTGSDQDNTLLGYGGNDLLVGLEGNDSLRGEIGTDHLFGGRGNDVLNGGAGADILDGGEGHDSADYRDTTTGVVVNLAANTASGGAAEGDSFLSIENIYGTDHEDILTGSDQDNTLHGYNSEDVINGGLGRDVLCGGSGRDCFVFDTTLQSPGNIDRILDFEIGQDSIVLSRAIFTALSQNGVLDTTCFRSNATGFATEHTDILLYNTTSGALLYDADGNGQGMAIQFAALTSKPQLSASDFMITA
jgi:Ca2+-binding RTX toxin-like protein